MKMKAWHQALLCALALVAVTGAAAATPELWQLTTDQCGGVRRNQEDSLRSVSYVVSQATSWDLSWADRKCPEGSHWATSQEFYALGGVHGDESQCEQPTGNIYYNLCGWSGYTPPGSTSHVYFLFRDSISSNIVHHANNAACSTTTVSAMPMALIMRRVLALSWPASTSSRACLESAAVIGHGDAPGKQRSRMPPAARRSSRAARR